MEKIIIKSMQDRTDRTWVENELNQELENGWTVKDFKMCGRTDSSNVTVIFVLEKKEPTKQIL